MSIEWAAGLFEGEGYIRKQHNRNRSRRFEVKIRMTDRDIIERMHTLFGGKFYIDTPPRQPHLKQAWVWALYKKEDIQSFLSKILPLLGQRRAYAALNVLDNIEL